MNRVLLAARLSRLDDESTSIERQQADMDVFATLRRLIVIGRAIDEDVSALTVSPFDRPHLGDWLNTRADEYDAVAFWRLDRVCRNLTDMFELIKWAKAHQKKIYFVTGPFTEIDFDDPTSTGELIAVVLGWAAQLEGITTRERIVSSQNLNRSQGKWTGGTWPYGMRPIKQDKGWKLGHDPVTAPILRNIIERLMDGETQQRIADDFNAQGIATPLNHQRKYYNKPTKPGKWTASTVSTILMNKTLLGYQTHKKEVVFSAEGTPVMAAVPLVTHEELASIQAIKDDRKNAGRKKVYTRTILSGVMFCGVCGTVLYRHAYDGYTYMKCHTCPKDVRADNFEEVFASVFLSQVGDLEVLKRVYVLGSDNSEELEKVERSMRMLEDSLSSGALSDIERFPQLIAKLSSKRAELLANPSTPSHYEWVGTGTTYTDWWLSADLKARRQLLLDSEVKAYAGKGDPRAEGRAVFTPSYEDAMKIAEAGEFTVSHLGPDVIGHNSYITIHWHGNLAERLRNIITQ